MMTNSLKLNLDKMPATLNLYSRAIIAQGSNKPKNKEIPEIEVNVKGIKLCKKNVSDYADICGFKFDGKTIPLSYPHVPAFSLHMELMVNKAFPLPVIGLVHVRNELTAHRAVTLDETLDIKVFISGRRSANKGLEFDITTEVTIKNTLVWDSVSTFLYRHKSTNENKKKSSPLAGSKYPYQQDWTLQENLGRNYALISGDSNPIHIHSLTAKLFGFKQAIAHGMWTKAKAISSLQPLLKSSALRVKVDFKQPVFLPCKLKMNYQEGAKDSFFEVKSEDQSKLHMSGKISLLK